MSLERRFPDELQTLYSLFGKEGTQDKLLRLNKIHDKSEQYWYSQLDAIPKRRVKYLLIAEAPPWSDTDDIVYVYNPKSKPRTLLTAITKAFLMRHFIKKSVLKRLSSF